MSKEQWFAEGPNVYDENRLTVARFVDAVDADTAALCVNAHDELVEALSRFLGLCPTSEGLGGHAPIGAFIIAANYARAALEKAQS